MGYVSAWGTKHNWFSDRPYMYSEIAVALRGSTHESEARIQYLNTWIG